MSEKLIEMFVKIIFIAGLIYIASEVSIEGVFTIGIIYIGLSELLKQNPKQQKIELLQLKNTKEIELLLLEQERIIQSRIEQYDPFSKQ